MTDTGLVVVVPTELQNGFRLAGVETVGVATSDEAAGSLRELISEERGALIAVYEPYLSTLGASEREELASSLSPVVVPLPSGLERHDEESHQARIAAMLSRAVGYHTTFRGEGAE